MNLWPVRWESNDVVRFGTIEEINLYENDVEIRGHFSQQNYISVDEEFLNHLRIMCDYVEQEDLLLKTYDLKEIYGTFTFEYKGHQYNEFEWGKVTINTLSLFYELSGIRHPFNGQKKFCIEPEIVERLRF